MYVCVCVGGCVFECVVGEGGGGGEGVYVYVYLCKIEREGIAIVSKMKITLYLWCIQCI